jgi:hypothetical protein
MSEFGELFSALRARSAARRAENRKHAPAMLQQEGIAFESKNDGAHLIVAGEYDFWPGTGLWRHRRDRKSSRGIKKLIRRIREA